MVIHTLTAPDAAYLAGLIDGEGTITLTRKYKNENRQLAITISNTEKQLLDFCINKIGAGKITRKRTYKENHTPSYTYAIYNRQALSMLKQIKPYLLSYKAIRAQLIIDNYLALTPRNGKYTDEIREKRSLFEQQVLSTKAN